MGIIVFGASGAGSATLGNYAIQQSKMLFSATIRKLFKSQVFYEFVTIT